MIVDIIVDLQYGDCGKGKISHHLLRQGAYTHCLRYNGGCNAGHTIYHKGKKFITHHIPAGVFFGVRSIIGAGCVVNLEQFFKEIEELEAGGIECDGLIKIAKNAHIVTDRHIAEESLEKEIGTTRRGNGPAYRDKYARHGLRAEMVPALSEYVVDLYEELHTYPATLVLCEGAQGFGLDIDWGDYPYVTSSHCTTAGALLNGIPASAVRKVWGVAKAYETYVGSKKFHGDGIIFDKLQKVGDEYGATTGRPRQCNWTNLTLLDKAIKINGVTDLVINKVDILRKLDTWSFRLDNQDGVVIHLQSEDSWKDYLEIYLPPLELHFSDNPERI
jgi:adenylosuccinate synthase